jgi:hypothetical protein
MIDTVGLRSGLCARAAIWAMSLLISYLVVPTGSAVAQPHGWSEPTQVSTPIAHQVDWFPRVAADNLGNVHVVWNSTSYDDPQHIYSPREDPENALGQLAYARWNGESWTPQTDLAIIWYGYALRTSLAVDPTGQVHLVYKGYGSADLQSHPREHQDIYYFHADGSRADSLPAWSDPRRISSGAGIGYFSDVAVDSKGVIHVIGTESDSTARYGLFYANSSDDGASWTEPQSLGGDETVWWYRTHLKIDQQDRLHVVWEVAGNDNNGLAFGVTRKAVYAQSADGGSTWIKREFTGVAPPRDGDPNAVAGPQQPVIGVDGNGTIVLVYREYGTDRVLYRQSRDGVQWSGPLAISGIKAGIPRPYDVYDTATDSAGHIHLVLIAYATGSTDMSVMHAEWSGQSWDTAEVIATPRPFPEYPRIAIGEGNRLHVVWFGGDLPTTDRTPAGIWYSFARSSAPSTLGQLPGLAPAVALQQVTGSGPSSRSATPAPTPVLVPPTPEPLSAAQRTAYTSTSLTNELLRQPVLPIAVAVILALLALASAMFVRWLTSNISRGRFDGR